jgi:hypothetical protein
MAGVKLASVVPVRKKAFIKKPMECCFLGRYVYQNFTKLDRFHSYVVTRIRIHNKLAAIHMLGVNKA